MTAEAIVRVEGLVKRYGSIVAVDGIGFDVGRGEMFGLIGPDGAGKTSTLRVLLGLSHRDAGTVSVCGLDPASQGRLLSGRVGYLSQRFSLYGDLSVDENIAFFAALHDVKGWRPRRDGLLDMLRMTPFRARQADRLSGGMKQKLALACTLIHTPELIVLDEPTTGVDPVSRRDFWKILVQVQEQGVTILLTTPYLDEAERCRRVAMMSGGRLLAVDDPRRLRREAPGTMVEVLARPARRAAGVARSAPGVESVQVFGERLHVSIPGVSPPQAAEAAERLAALLRAEGLEVESARPVPFSLEDVFIARLQGPIAAAGAP
ncbi:MAG TPA: ABC transporter ATP-binding protein [Candidatus Polarisedimenticolia bacterium]|nr:ABC transporter ATP-binding protein [Candidatus Polarisedimenticolia bacterium]